MCDVSEVEKFLDAFKDVTDFFRFSTVHEGPDEKKTKVVHITAATKAEILAACSAKLDMNTHHYYIRPLGNNVVYLDVDDVSREQEAILW